MSSSGGGGNNPGAGGGNNQLRFQPPVQLLQLWANAPAGTRLLVAATCLLSVLGLFIGGLLQPLFVLSPFGVFYLGRGWTIVTSYLYRPLSSPIIISLFFEVITVMAALSYLSGLERRRGTLHFCV